MTNLEQIYENNTSLTNCINLASSLPDAGGGGDNGGSLMDLYQYGIWSSSEITSLPNDFCRGWLYIKELDFPNATVAGSYICYNGTRLESVNLPKCTRIGDYSFYNCTSLQTINCPNINTIGESLFRDCSSLTELVFLEATSIGTYGVRACTSLTRADFSKLATIGNNAFLESSALVTLIIRTDSVCKMNNVNSLLSTPIAEGTGYVYVPASLLEDYKSASNWSTYAAQIRAIEDYPEITGG